MRSNNTNWERCVLVPESTKHRRSTEFVNKVVSVRVYLDPVHSSPDIEITLQQSSTVSKHVILIMKYS